MCWTGGKEDEAGGFLARARRGGHVFDVFATMRSRPLSRKAIGDATQRYLHVGISILQAGQIGSVLAMGCYAAVCYVMHARQGSRASFRRVCFELTLSGRNA